MKLFVTALFLLTSTCVQALVDDACRTDSECDPGECCQILKLFPIMSRRQIIGLTKPRLDLTRLQLVSPSPGTCQPYRTEYEPCSAFDKPNGYCGCGRGLKCHSYEVQVVDAVQAVQLPVRRSMLAPRPGTTWRTECWSLDRLSQP
ncbi:hypothetical protein BaRGS_00037013 [Batillaria attramentaria]|uniref:Uncharacterized protein n=1 Tax=Batillaria attramentaria TaxID=370345 RepID=A0ABD0JAB1_9CAEN